MIVYHASKMLALRGDYVVPTNFWRRSAVRLVQFSETQEGAARFIANRLAGWSVYAAGTANLPELEPHAWLAGCWVTAHPCPVSAFTATQIENDRRGEMLSVQAYLESLGVPFA